jgi:hypothetical protein
LIERGFEPRSRQTQDYKTGICCFFAKDAALRRNIESKDWLARQMCPMERNDLCFNELAL